MVTLAAEELTEFGLAEVETAGRKRNLRFLAVGHALWELALPHLRSPVVRRYWARGTAKTLPSAGLSALEQMSDVMGDAVPVFAESARVLRALLDEGVLTVCEIQDDAELLVEAWRYAPQLFAKDGCVDKLSLFLSLRDMADERVQAALNKMLEEMTWCIWCYSW